MRIRSVEVEWEANGLWLSCQGDPVIGAAANPAEAEMLGHWMWGAGRCPSVARQSDLLFTDVIQSSHSHLRRRKRWGWGSQGDANPLNWKIVICNRIMCVLQPIGASFLVNQSVEPSMLVLASIPNQPLERAQATSHPSLVVSGLTSPTKTLDPLPLSLLCQVRLPQRTITSHLETPSTDFTFRIPDTHLAITVDIFTASCVTEYPTFATALATTTAYLAG